MGEMADDAYDNAMRQEAEEEDYYEEDYNFFNSKIVGTTFYPKAAEIIPTLKHQDLLILKREPENEYDENAIAVYKDEDKIGHIPAHTAIQLAKLMDEGTKVTCNVEEVTGGGNFNHGCNIKIIHGVE